MMILKKTVFTIIFSLLLTGLCLAQDADDHFKRGAGFLETRLIDQAIEEFKKALPLFKEDQGQMKAETYTLLANAYNWKGIHKAAITACKKAIEINPDLANAHYNLGFAYREEGNAELARKEFALYEKILRQEGEYIEVPGKTAEEDIDKYITLGDNYFKEGKLDEAIAEYKKAFEINPRDDILNKLGQVHQQKRLADKSEDQSVRIETFTGEETLDDMPELSGRDKIDQKDLIEELFGRGISYYNKGMVDKAIEEFREVLEIDPEDTETQYNLGNAHADKGMFDEAISIYETIVEKHPEYTEACLSLGILYLDMEMIDDAISLYKRAVNTNPDNSFLFFHLGEAYARNGQHKEAITEYSKAISINQMDPETQYRLAESYYETRQYGKALEHARQAEKLGYITDSSFMVDLEKKADAR